MLIVFIILFLQVTKILQDIGIEKMDSMTLMADPTDPNCNRGFAFLDFATNKDAQIALKKLQKKDAFGKGHLVKVAWAEPFNNPDEEEMQKVTYCSIDNYRGALSLYFSNFIRLLFRLKLFLLKGFHFLGMKIKSKSCFLSMERLKVLYFLAI